MYYYCCLSIGLAFAHPIEHLHECWVEVSSPPSDGESTMLQSLLRRISSNSKVTVRFLAHAPPPVKGVVFGAPLKQLHLLGPRSWGRKLSVSQVVFSSQGRSLALRPRSVNEACYATP